MADACISHLIGTSHTIKPWSCSAVHVFSNHCFASSGKPSLYMGTLPHVRSRNSGGHDVYVMRRRAGVPQPTPNKLGGAATGHGSLRAERHTCLAASPCSSNAQLLASGLQNRLPAALPTGGKRGPLPHVTWPQHWDLLCATRLTQATVHRLPSPQSMAPSAFQ